MSGYKVLSGADLAPGRKKRGPGDARQRLIDSYQDHAQAANAHGDRFDGVTMQPEREAKTEPGKKTKKGDKVGFGL